MRNKFGPPMTLANMRLNGVPLVTAICEACGHAADVNVDALPESVHAPHVGRRLRYSRCGGKRVWDKARMAHRDATPQCDVREFLRHPRMRVDRSASLPNSQRGADGRLSVHRRLLQPVPSPLGPRLSVAHRIRKETR